MTPLNRSRPTSLGRTSEPLSSSRLPSVRMRQGFATQEMGSTCRTIGRPRTGELARPARDPEVREDHKALAELIATIPVEDPSVSLLLALETSMNDDDMERLRFLKRVQHAHPDDLWTNQRLGFVCMHFGLPGEAVGYYQAAVAVRPESGLLRNNLGRALTDVGRREEGMKEYYRAVDLDPTAGEIHANLAKALGAQGKIDEAVGYLRDAIRAEEPIVLLIDEVDRVEIETEALLLEVLSDFQVSVPELGTIVGKQRPLVFLTSNNTRELSEALKRRCLYLHIDYPDLDREKDIVRVRVPEVDDALAEQIAKVVGSIRNIDLKKAPSISETIDWARTLLYLGRNEITPEVLGESLHVLLKYQSDITKARKELGVDAPATSRK